MAGLGLWEIMDFAMADALDVDVETYIRIIECECTEDEADFIIITIMEGDAENLQKAKETFNKYLDE